MAATRTTVPSTIGDNGIEAEVSTTTTCYDGAQEELEIRQRLISLAKRILPNHQLPNPAAMSQSPMDGYFLTVYDAVRNELTPVMDPAFSSIQEELVALAKQPEQHADMTEFDRQARRDSLSQDYDRMLNDFNQAKDEWESNVKDEIARRWEDELEESERQTFARQLQGDQAVYRTFQQAEDDLQQELKRCITDTTKKNVLTQSQTQTQRFPDHNFAIQQTRMIFNWALAPWFLYVFQTTGSSDETFPWQQALISESNIPGVLPTFVDSDWLGWDIVGDYCPRARARFDALPADKREERWAQTAYYKVYPNDNGYMEEDDAYEASRWGLGRPSLPFSRNSIRQFFQLLLKDLTHDAKGGGASTTTTWTRRSFREVLFLEDSANAAGAIVLGKVTSFQSHAGDRIEVWEGSADEDVDGSYAILQSHQGRLVIISVAESRPFVICNLLQYSSSHYAFSDMPDLLSELSSSSASGRVYQNKDGGVGEDRLPDDDVVQKDASALAKLILATAEEILYGPSS